MVTEKKTIKRVQPTPEDVAVPIPPDGGYGWVVLVAAFVKKDFTFYESLKDSN